MSHLVETYKAFPGNPDKDLVKIPCTATEVVGRAVSIVPEFIDTFENLEQRKVFVPIHAVSQMLSDYIICTRLMAKTKGLL